MIKLDYSHNKFLDLKDRISIVIIVKGREHHLKNTLESLNTNFPFFNELILVNMNQDINKTIYDYIKYPIIQTSLYTPNEELPLAKARNLGARLSSSSKLLFLDVDCIVSPNICKEYIRAITNNPHNIYMSKCLYLEEKVNYFKEVFSSISKEHPKRTVDTYPKWQFFWSLSFAIDKKRFRRLGEFDENFLNYGGEDTEFSYRNYLDKGELVWVPTTSVYHQPHTSNTLPLHHIKSVINNVNYFYSKYGFYIMENWLKGFLELDLIEKIEGGSYRIK